MWRWWQRRRFRARMRRDEAAMARTAAVVAAPEVEGWNGPTRWLVPGRPAADDPCRAVARGLGE